MSFLEIGGSSMKIHATKNFINKHYKNIYCVGYEDLHFLLKAYDAVFYNAGQCGWNWDAYEVDYNTVIITGYRNFTGYTIPYETALKYDQQARNLHCNSCDWNATREQLHQLMQELLQELKK